MSDTTKLRIGIAIRVLVVLFLVFDAVIKLIQIAPVTESFNKLGYSPTLAMPVGIIGIVCALLYSFRGTAVLGAITITGLCGGAIASHLRIDSPLFTHVLFGSYVAVLAWLGLWLTDPGLRRFIPITQAGHAS